MRRIASSGHLSRSNSLRFNSNNALLNKFQSSTKHKVLRPRRIFTFLGSKYKNSSISTPMYGETSLGTSLKTNASTKTPFPTDINVARSAKANLIKKNDDASRTQLRLKLTQKGTNAPLPQSLQQMTNRPATRNRKQMPNNVANQITASQLVFSNEDENCEQIGAMEDTNEHVHESILHDKDAAKSEFKIEASNVTPEVLSHSESLSVQQQRKRSSSSRNDPEEVIRKIKYHYRSPIAYRKIYYDDANHKWIEHRIYEVENDDILQKKVQSKISIRPRKPHRIKGRQTAIVQHMLPTALIKSKTDDKIYRNIDMTDQLRMELHKRNMPVVPTYFQEHIYKFGKLPFRNNPRMH